VKKHLFAYKEPFLVFAATVFAEHFKNSKFIHIIRDGRDCADSMVRTYPHALVDQVLRDPVLGRLKGSEIGLARRWHEWHLPWWLPEGTEEAFVRLQPYCRYVFMWHVMVGQGLSLGRMLPAERYLELRYEDFCRQPHEAGQRILAFLGCQSCRPFRRILGSMTTRSVKCHVRQEARILQEANHVGKSLLRELNYL
jgi:hypothetical protein